MAHSIGKTIAELRKAKGWTQIELAEKLNVSDKAVSKWESEGGFPEITQLPVLAKIFDVSIDCLMTGKETEPEIITMSKIELCAKNDDVELFETLSYDYLKTADENGKTILDYMLQYDCDKVVNAFFKKYPVKTIQQSNTHRAGAPLWYTEKVLKLLILNNLVDELLSVNLFTRITGRQTIATEWNIYTEKYRTLIFTHEKIAEDLKKIYIQSLNESEFNITICLLLDNKKEKDIQLLWTIIYNKSTIKLSLSTLQKLLDNGYIEIVKQANQMNKTLGAPTISEELIQVAVLKQNGGATEEINKLSVMQNGIVNIDKLLVYKDFKFIKKMLNEYPIHFIEILNEKKSDKKFLFKYAVDTGDNELADMVVKNEMDIVTKGVFTAGMNTPLATQKMPKFDRLLLTKYWYNNQSGSQNKAYLYLIENGQKIELLGERYGRRFFAPKNLEEVILKLQAVKQRIIDELSLKLDKEKTIGDLTKEYFEAELAKGNIEIVIIKLCVRLEAILRSDYLYEGDFSEMLKKYCDSKLNWEEDDGWGYMVNKSDDKTIRLLNNLRIKRNSIVHSEKTNVELSLEEIRYCIDYICKMG